MMMQAKLGWLVYNKNIYCACKYRDNIVYIYNNVGHLPTISNKSHGDTRRRSKILQIISTVERTIHIFTAIHYLRQSLHSKAKLIRMLFFHYIWRHLFQDGIKQNGTQQLYCVNISRTKRIFVCIVAFYGLHYFDS